jgi:hypothetical protein
MENTENIKDPNQLDLFAGILLTTEQQEQVDRYIENQNKNITFQENENQRIENMLIEAGFIKGVHYKNDFKSSIDTRKVTLGYSYNQTQFEVEVTAKFYTGGISLLGKRFDLSTKELRDATFNFDVQRDKIQSWTIQDQSRYVKPKTLLTKLLEHNEKEKQRFEEYNKSTVLLNATLNKYKTLYPSATVTSGRDYAKYYGSFDVVKVEFESGSFIEFRIDPYNDRDVMFKKKDVEYEALSTEELLKRFSKQAKKEGSN